jgi:hypothetical protein
LEGQLGEELCVSAALKSVASNLQAWDEDVVGDLPRRIREKKHELDKCMRSPICQGKVAEEVRLRRKLDLLEEMHNIKWKQRAHAWWLRDGDRRLRSQTAQKIYGQLVFECAL